MKVSWLIHKLTIFLHLKVLIKLDKNNYFINIVPNSFEGAKKRKIRVKSVRNSLEKLITRLGGLAVYF